METRVKYEIQEDLGSNKMRRAGGGEGSRKTVVSDFRNWVTDGASN